jgi:squalene-associated FAD-dependent desaturase
MADLGPHLSGPRSAAVIGGGWAGCAAAARLADAGVRVTLFEAAAELGGRGRRVTIELGGSTHVLDNGQHLMIGAYTAIARLLAAVGVDLDTVVERRPFELAYPDGWRLRAAPLPAPWHLLGALVTARGPRWRDRWTMAHFLHRLRTNGWQVAPDRAADVWLAEQGQGDALVASVWRPLCVAALNTRLAEASAQLFANVLRDSLGADRTAATLWLPRVDLSALLPDAVERHVRAQGGEVRRGTRVERVRCLAGGFDLEPALGRFDAVVYAAPPAQLGRIGADLAPALSDALDTVDAFDFEPICTVYLKYGPEVALPGAFRALRDDPGRRAYGQWVFDRGALDPANAGVFAVVVSASGAHDDEPLAALCDAVAAQLTRALHLPAPLAARAIVEKRATLAARPGLRRPGNETPIPGFVLAGDWTHGDHPSTLESAVRSGEAAAARLLGAR